MNTQEQQTARPVHSTINQFVEDNPAFTHGGIRHNIFHEDTNGLKESGAIIRNGKRILIHNQRFYNWLDSKNGVSA